MKQFQRVYPYRVIQPSLFHPLLPLHFIASLFSILLSASTVTLSRKMDDVRLLVIGPKFRQDIDGLLANVSKTVTNKLYVRVAAELDLFEV